MPRGGPVEFVLWVFVAVVALVGGLLVGGLVGRLVGSDLFGGGVFSVIVIVTAIAARRRGWLDLLAYLLGLVLTTVIGFLIVVNVMHPR